MNFRRQSLLLLLTGVIAVMFIGCQSQELTSAKLYIQQQNWEKAEEFLKKAEEVEPNNAEIPFLLGSQIYARQGKWEQMNQAFDRSLEVGNQYKKQIENVRTKHWTEQFNTGAKKYNAALEQQGEERTNLLNQAVANFENAVTIDPSKSETYGSLATAYLLLEDIDQAKKTFEQALDQDPENFQVLFNYGKVLAEEGDTEKAISILEKAREIKPEESSVIQILANLYVQAGQKEAALTMYDKATDQNPENANLFFNKAILHIQMAQTLEEEQDTTAAEEQYQAAIDAMDQAVQINPDDLEAQQRLGELHQEMENWEEAANVFRTILEKDIDDQTRVQILRKLAVTVYRQGEPEEGQELLNKAKSLEKELQGAPSE